MRADVRQALGERSRGSSPVRLAGPTNSGPRALTALPTTPSGFSPKSCGGDTVMVTTASGPSRDPAEVPELGTAHGLHPLPRRPGPSRHISLQPSSTWAVSFDPACLHHSRRACQAPTYPETPVPERGCSSCPPWASLLSLPPQPWVGPHCHLPQRQVSLHPERVCCPLALQGLLERGH